MAWTLEFRNKSQEYIEVALAENEAGSLSQRFENQEHNISFDTLNIQLDNTDHYWDTIFTASNLPPTDEYPSKYGFRIKRNGTPYWEGDLDYASVEFDDAKDVVNVVVDDAIDRLKRYNAAKFIRDYSTIEIVSGVKQTKVLQVNSVLDANGEPLTEGDQVKLAHVKANGKIIFQTLTVKSVNIDTNKITFKKRLKAEYNSNDNIVVVKPWYRGKTADWLINALLDFAEWPEQKRSISYSTSYTDIIDIADFTDCCVGDAINKVANYVNANVFCNVDVLTVSERTNPGEGNVIPLDDDIAEENAVAVVGAERYDAIKVTGAKNRHVKLGKSPIAGDTLEIDFPFSSDYDRLKDIAERLYDYWSRYRSCYKSLPVWDKVGLKLNSRVSINSIEYKVTALTRDLSEENAIIVDLIEVPGTLPDVSLYEDNELEDDDEEPPPPLNFTLTKNYSDVFNTLYPASKYPRRVAWDEVSGDPPNLKITRKVIRFYEFKWTYPYDEIMPIWKFYITVWHDGADRDKPKKHKAVPPVLQANGYYYYGCYLPAGKKFWADVQAVLEDLRASELSDENSTSIEDDDIAPGAEYDTPVITGVSLSSSEDDIGGTAITEYNLKATVSWTGTASHIRIKVVAPNNAYYNTFEADQSGETFEFPRMFKRGKSLHVYVRAWNVAAKTDWYDAGTITAGNSAIPNPTACTITGIDRYAASATLHITLPNDSTIGALVVYKAPSGTSGNPTTNSAWRKVWAGDVEDDIASGNLNIDIEINKVKGKKAFIAKTCSRYDKTIKTWSSIYDESSIGDVSFTYSSSCDGGDTEDIITVNISSSGNAIAELEKIQICKGTSSAPNTNKRRAPIDCLDYDVDPPACTNTSFEATLSHASGATPIWWMRFVLVDGRFLKPTGHQDGWVKVGTGGGQVSKMSAPTSIEVTKQIDGSRYIKAIWASGKPSDLATLKVYATNNMSATEDTSQPPTTQWGINQNLTQISSDSTSVTVKITSYYNMSTGQNANFTTSEISFKVAVAALASDGQTAGYYAFKTINASTAGFATPTPALTISRDGNLITMTWNFASTNNPTSMGIVFRTSSPASGQIPSTKPTTWSSYSPDNLFSKPASGKFSNLSGNGTVTEAEAGRLSFPAGTTQVTFTLNVGTAAAIVIAACIGINGTDYGSWGNKYDAGSGGGGGTTPPTPSLTVIDAQLGSNVGVVWTDGNQYYVELQYKTSSSSTTYYNKNSTTLVSSTWNSALVLRITQYYRARLKNASGTYGEYSEWKLGSTIT